MLLRGFMVIAVVVLAGAMRAQGAGDSGPDRRASFDDVLASLPADAHLVVLIPSLTQLARELAAFGEAAEIPLLSSLSPQELLRGPLRSAAAAFDLDGPLAIALSADTQETLIVGRSSSTACAAEAMRVTESARYFDLDDAGVLAQTARGLSLLARDDSALERAIGSDGGAGRRMAAALGDLPKRRLIILYADVQPWKPHINAMLQLVAQASSAGVVTSGGDAEAALLFQRWAFDEMRRLVDGTQSYVLGASASAQGVAIEDRLCVVADSPLAGYFQKVKRSGQDILRGLQVTHPALVMGMEWELPADVLSVEERMLDVLANSEVLRGGIEKERFERAIKRAKGFQREITGYCLAWDWCAESDAAFFHGLYFTRDPDGIRHHLREMFDDFPEFMSGWGGMPSHKVQHRVERVADVEADTFVFSFEPGSNPAVDPVFEAIYGRSPMMQLASHRDGVVYAVGPHGRTTGVLGECLGGAPSNAAENARVRAVLDRLELAEPQFCALLDVSRAVEIVVEVARAMGMPLARPPQRAAPAPLIGYAARLEPDGIHGKGFASAESVREMMRLSRWFTGVVSDAPPRDPPATTTAPAQPE